MGKRYFHVCTKGSDLEWMFRDDRDFVVGVNRAKKLRYEYASTPKQISRMLQLEIDIVKGFV